MATIRKKGECQWHVQIRKKGYPPVTKTFFTWTEADAWAKVTESEMVRGVFVDRSDAERTTIEDVIDRFIIEFAPYHYRQREDKKEAWRFQCQRLKEKLGLYSLAALDQKLVAAYRDDRLKEVGESTVRKELYMLSKVLRFAEIEVGIALPRGTPVLKIRKPADGKSRDRRLTQDEWNRLESECRQSRNLYLWPAVELAVETAMRQGELLGLLWKNIDKSRPIAFLENTKNGEARAVPLSSRAVAILKGLTRSIDGKVLPVERMTIITPLWPPLNARKSRILLFTIFGTKRCRVWQSGAICPYLKLHPSLATKLYRCLNATPTYKPKSWRLSWANLTAY